MRFVALDIESTGTNPRKDRIIELHIREVTWPLLFTKKERTVLCNPQVPIPPEATLVNGFTDDMVKECLPFVYSAPDVQDLLTFDGECVIIAYNGRRFDVPLLHNELRRCGMPGLEPDQPIIDPYEIFLQHLPRSLTGALKYYAGENHDGAHDAKNDVEAMIKVLGNQLLYQPYPEILEAALKNDKRPLDHCGCFYEDSQGVIRFGFGKHKGESALAHPDYLKWILRHDFDDDVKRLAKNCLEDHTPAAA